ncbi:MAG: hypothetical protein ACRD2E_10680 [Terriglobales bacterium]
MLPPAPVGPNRWRLGFPEAVVESFRFLEDLGFRIVKRLPTFVRYESGQVFVNIYHGLSSCEIGVEVGRRDLGHPYRLPTMVEWAGEDAYEREGFGRHVMFQVSTREDVQTFAPKVASLVQRYGAEFLRGDPAFYEAVHRWAVPLGAAYVASERDRVRRDRAERARMARDFATMARAYDELEGELTPLERKRLEYAHKRIAGGL